VRSLAALAVLVAGAASAQAPDVQVTLSPAIQDVVQGGTPRFDVEVSAKERLRVVDFAHRPDLAERLVKPRLAGKGDMDDMPFELSDMGPVGESDYVVLEPGATMRFTNRGEPFRFGVLAPGEYTVYLRFRTDFPSPIVESSRVRFRVVPPKGESR
jgi:hypothetical protein